jgi:hypothetical protein
MQAQHHRILLKFSFLNFLGFIHSQYFWCHLLKMMWCIEKLLEIGFYYWLEEDYFFGLDITKMSHYSSRSSFLLSCTLSIAFYLITAHLSNFDLRYKFINYDSLYLLYFNLKSSDLYLPIFYFTMNFDYLLPSDIDCSFFIDFEFIYFS